MSGAGSRRRLTASLALWLACGCALAMPAIGNAASRVEVYPNRIEVQGDSAANKFYVTRSLTGDILISDKSGGEIENIVHSDTKDSCRRPRVPGSARLQANISACPRRDLVLLKAGAGNDTVELGEPAPATISVDGEDGRDEISGRNGLADSCAGGDESPAIEDIIRYCGPQMQVTWEAINSPLDTNPASGGGARIFPDRISPTDSVDRALVRVKVTAAPALAGQTVYLRSFDVDDPAFDPDVDFNGAAGRDNRTLGAGLVKEGVLSTDSVVIDPDGTASTVLSLGQIMQPGNNFVVGASRNQDELTSLGDVTPGVEPGAVALTEMLTVWRKLHIELDSMVAPGLANTPSGTVNSSVLRPDGTQLCDLTVNTMLADQEQYEHGWLVSAGVKYTVRSNSAFGSLTVVAVSGNRCPAVGSAFTIHDDDVDTVLPRQPSVALLQPVDSGPTNVLKGAYIRPVVVPDPNDGVPFVRNLEDAQVNNVANPIYSKRDLTHNSNLYWSEYLLSTFQGSLEKDEDPETEASTLGVTPNHQGVADNNRGLVHQEVLRDSCPANFGSGRTEAHEVGHALRADHDDEGMMLGCTPTPAFNNESLARMRLIARPGASY